MLGRFFQEKISVSKLEDVAHVGKKSSNKCGRKTREIEQIKKLEDSVGKFHSEIRTFGRISHI